MLENGVVFERETSEFESHLTVGNCTFWQPVVEIFRKAMNKCSMNTVSGSKMITVSSGL